MFASSQIYRYETDTREFAQKCSLQLGKNESISSDGDGNPVLPCHRKELQLNLFKEIVPATGQQLHPHAAVGEAAPPSIRN